MTQLSREEYIELGVSVPTDTLIEWAARQLAATKGRETRLQSRGMSAPQLTGMRDLLAMVEKRHGERGTSEESPPAVALAQRIREEAVSYWQEAKQIVQVEFGTTPDLIAKFRIGVRTGRLILPLRGELESMVRLLREYAPQLAGVGGTEAFIARGAILVDRLKEVKTGLDAACQAFPPPAAQQCHDKGLLYDLIRKLVRVGRLEFALDPEQAAAFNFTGLRRKGEGSARPGSRKAKVADRKSP